MAKLTKAMKQKFVDAVLGDVPVIDYQSQANEIVATVAKLDMPKKIRELIDDPECEQWISRREYRLPESRVIRATAYGCAGPQYEPIDISTRYPAAWNDLKHLAALDAEQHKHRRELRDAISACVDGINTVKQLADTFPEFAKHLPAGNSTSLKSLVSEKLKQIGAQYANND